VTAPTYSPPAARDDDRRTSSAAVSGARDPQQPQQQQPSQRLRVAGGRRERLQMNAVCDRWSAGGTTATAHVYGGECGRDCRTNHRTRRAIRLQQHRRSFPPLSYTAANGSNVRSAVAIITSHSTRSTALYDYHCISREA